MDMVYAIQDNVVLSSVQEDFDRLEQWKLGKETITQLAVEHDGVIVRDNSILKVADGAVEYQTAEWFEAREIARKEAEYKARVIELIREKHTQNDEFALMASGIADATSEHYLAYRAFVADCKVKGNQEIFG